MTAKPDSPRRPWKPLRVMIVFLILIFETRPFSGTTVIEPLAVVFFLFEF